MWHAESPVGKAEEKSDSQNVAPAPQRDQPSPQRLAFAPLQALHLKRRGYARHKQEQRRGHPADELRQNKVTARKEVHTRELIEHVAFNHNNHGQSPHQVEKRKSL